MRVREMGLTKIKSGVIFAFSATFLKIYLVERKIRCTFALAFQEYLKRHRMGSSFKRSKK